MLIKLHNFKEVIKLVFKNFFSKKDNEEASYVLAEKISHYLYPKYRFSEFGRIWLGDTAFFRYYEKYDKNNYHSADRKFFLKSLLNLIKNLPGDTVECGVYMGAASELICESIKSLGKTHHAFDSFEGLSEPNPKDGNHWRKGDLKAGLEEVKKNLSAYTFVKFYKGWIPERFNEVTNKNFCFVHIDVDLYQPTLNSLRFFFPKMVKGGVIVCDDYGFSTCPGAKKAFDEFMKDKMEQIIHVPTGQCFIIKN